MTKEARSDSNAATIKKAQEEAVMRLDNVTAWPDDVGAFRIDVVAGNGVITTTDPPESGRDTDVLPHRVLSYQVSSVRPQPGINILALEMQRS